MEQARKFRKRLINEIYPELAGYLQDRQYLDMAVNMHTTVAAVRQAFPSRDLIQTAIRIVMGCDATSEGEKYTPDFVSGIWKVLRRCNANPELVKGLMAEQPNIFDNKPKMERWRFRFPKEFVAHLPVPFARTQRYALPGDVTEHALRRKLMEEYSWLWLLTGVFLVTLTLWYGLLLKITNLIGAVVPTSALFLLGLLSY